MADVFRAWNKLNRFSPRGMSLYVRLAAMRFLRWVGPRERIPNNPTGANCGGGSKWVCPFIESGRNCHPPRLPRTVVFSFLPFSGPVGHSFRALYYG
jgi:hypothetical protein